MGRPWIGWDGGQGGPPFGTGHVASERSGAGTSVEVFSRAGVRGHDDYWRTAERLEWMKYKLATTLLVVAALVVATFSAATTTAPPARAAVDRALKQIERDTAVYGKSEGLAFSAAGRAWMMLKNEPDFATDGYKAAIRLLCQGPVQ